jgi:hypothetical protein
VTERPTAGTCAHNCRSVQRASFLPFHRSAVAVGRAKGSCACSVSMDETYRTLDEDVDQDRGRGCRDPRVEWGEGSARTQHYPKGPCPLSPGHEGGGQQDDRRIE